MAQTWERKLLTAILFVFCGIPGILAFLYGSILMVVYFIEPQHNDKLPSLITLAVIASLGLFLSLIGAGKLREWHYAFVFLSIPVSLFSIGLVAYVLKFPFKGYWIFGGTGFIAYLVHKFVQRSYNTEHRNQGCE